MIINGLVLDENIKYVKFHKSTDIKSEINEELHALDIYATNSSDIQEYSCIKDFPIVSDHEYIKLGKFSHATFPNFKLTKFTYEPLEVNIFIVKMDSENKQVDGDDNEDIRNTAFYFYDRLTILMRDDKHTLADLAELMEDIPYIGFTPLSDLTSEVGNVPNVVIRNKDLVVGDYYSNEPLDFNGQISVLDWSHAFDKFLKLIMDDIKEFDFAEPVTRLAQEIPENANLLRYDIQDIQPDGRGHLVGSHWKYFLMHKLPFELEFVLTTTASYIRLLHDLQNYNKVTNIGSFHVTANNGMLWRVAPEWNFPIENNFDLTDPKGSSDTVGQVIKVGGFLHYFTVSKDKLMGIIEQILLLINNENDLIQKSIK